MSRKVANFPICSWNFGNSCSEVVPNNHAHYAAAAYGRCQDALDGAVEISTAENMIPNIDIWRCSAHESTTTEEASMEAATRPMISCLRGTWKHNACAANCEGDR
jgi:hypothetical protein